MPQCAVARDRYRRPAGQFLGEMTTPRRPGESLLQFLVGIFSQNFTLRVSIVRLLKYEHLHMKYLRVTIAVKAEWSFLFVMSVRVVDLIVKRFKNNFFKPNTRTFL